MNYNQKAREDFKDAPQSVVAWIIMASYGYYHMPQNPSLLSDECFDNMCKWLLGNYDSVQHRFKHIITKSHLEAGSLYDVHAYDYPAELVRIYNKLMEKI